MFKKLFNYLSRDTDYPLDANNKFIAKQGLDYHLNFNRLNRLYLMPNIKFDDTGVPKFNYSIVPPPNNKIGLIYNITYISWYALACLQYYLETGSNEAKNNFLRQAEWLLLNKANNQGTVSWPIRFPWNMYGVWLPIPRVSSMDQGLAISVLVRAYLLTQQRKYLDIAIQAEPFYEVLLEKGGFKCYLRNGSIFYEMFPCSKPSLILDGHLFSLMGLYDLYSVTADSQTKERFDNAVKTVIDNLDYWNYRNIWSWFGRFYLSTPMYHKINLCWLQILSEIAGGDDKLSYLSEAWTRSYSNRLLKKYLKYKLFMSHRLFFLDRGYLGSISRKKLI